MHEPRKPPALRQALKRISRLRSFAVLVVLPAWLYSPFGFAAQAGAQPAYACTQNCPFGDDKCLQACTSLNTPKQQQPSPPNFQCLNQCTRAGYAFAYCKKLCSP